MDKPGNNIDERTCAQTGQDSVRDTIEDAGVIAAKVTRLLPGCKRVLLVCPPQVPEADFDVDVAVQRRYPAFPPYGLGIINRKIKEQGYASDIMDLNFEVLASLKRDQSAFKYGIWKTLLQDRIAAFKPDIVGISCMYTMTAMPMYAVAEFIKQNNKDLTVIAGGVHPSNAAKTVLSECRAIDFVSLYEGDTSFTDLIAFINGKAALDRVRHIATMIDGTYHSLTRHTRESNIDTAPDFGNLPIGEYHFLGKVGAYSYLLSESARASSVQSNRGCRGRCTYCSVNAFFGKGVSSRSVKAVVDEMEYLKEHHGIGHFMWLDDDLLFNEKRALELFNEMIRRKLGITWDASNGVVAAALTPDIVEAAYKSGCIGLHLGIESGNPDILQSIRKPSSIPQFERAAEILHNYPAIFTKGFLMVGFQGETIGQVLDTVNLARRLRLDWYPIQILTVFPKTQMHEALMKEGAAEDKKKADRFFIGSTGGQRLREQQEKKNAETFVNLLEGDPHRIPTSEEIRDIWFLVDFKVNYEPIEQQNNPVKLALLQKMLADVCERVRDNPLATLYLGVVEEKLGNRSRAQELKKLAKTYLDASAFWQARFTVLGLHRILN